MRLITRGRSQWRELPRPWVAPAIVAALIVAVLPIVPLHAGSQSDVTMAATTLPDGATDAVPTDVLPPESSWTVTLLTGQVLDVQSDGEGRVTAVERNPSAPVRMVQEPDGDVYAIPLAVTPLVEHVLDLELFNLTGLIRQGYDDRATDVVPVIVQREPSVDIEAILAASGEELSLPSIDAVATEVPKAETATTGARLTELSSVTDPQTGSAGGITKVWLDHKLTTPSSPERTAAAPPQPQVPLAHNLVQVGADRAWAAGLEGEGVTVAVLDTGIDAQHPDLVGQVVAEENFSFSSDARDRVGHGTHVASIVAGIGAASGGGRRGVAPAAQLLNGKVLDDAGFGGVSDAIAGMEWAAPQADVINMSFGRLDPSDGSDPFSLALDVLSAQHDTLFVVAAGNSGPFSQTVNIPGAADRALTVGAVDGADVLAEFSSRGPLARSYELKPEVVAPGVDIVAARAAGTTLGEPVDDHYVRLSGTSMATPHVAGAAAILAQEHPDWSADQLKSGLVATSDPVDGDGFAVGAGRIDIGDGSEATISVDADVVDQTLPHLRTEPLVTPLTWTNFGVMPRTVVLEAELNDRDGRPLDGATVTPRELTLAPGATGTATLLVDGAQLPDGLYTGTVVADPDGDEGQDDIRTPIGVRAAPETAQLTIDATSPRGETGPPWSFAAVVNLDDLGEYLDLVFFEDTVTVGVPVGRYAVLGDVRSQDLSAYSVAQVGDPDIGITGDTTVAFDGRAAVPFHPTVEGVDTSLPGYVLSVLGAFPTNGAHGNGLLLAITSSYPLPPPYLVPMEADPEVFVASQTFRLQAPHITGRARRRTIDLTAVAGRELSLGDHRLFAVDSSDLADAREALAVVRLPADRAERAAVTRRAADAGVAVLAFVDEQQPHLPLFVEDGWGDVPVVGVASSSASTLLAAAQDRQEVTVTIQASPYVYDIAQSLAATVDPDPVITRADQRRLATLDERFHRDPDGTGAVFDGRVAAVASLGKLVRSLGPLPRRRTAHVTPDVMWKSGVAGPGLARFEGAMFPVPEIEYSVDTPTSYGARSRTTLSWLERPTSPAPIGVPLIASCEPRPTVRTADTLRVWLAPFQDGLDRAGCAAPQEATLMLERDGTVVGIADSNAADFSIPDEPATYRLSYDQTGTGPYPHRSTTSWTFPSAAPVDPGAVAGEQQIPLLVVDYDLPLDTLNRPTGLKARLVVHQVTGTEHQPIDSLRVWTSTDDGTSWQRASIRRTSEGAYRVGLPHPRPGVTVSLRVDAQDTAGNRIEQILYDAYTT